MPSLRVLSVTAPGVCVPDGRNHLLSALFSNNCEFLLSSVFVIVGQCRTREVPPPAQTGRLCTSLVYSDVSDTISDFLFLFSLPPLALTIALETQMGAFLPQVPF